MTITSIYFSSTLSVSADIDLPLIAVIGSQSVGKSSLIEAMSGVSGAYLHRYHYIVLKSGLTDRLTSREWNMHAVRSDSGPGSLSGPQTLLLRCPTECRLSSSEDDWSARVSIRHAFDKHGNPSERPTIQLFGDVITSKLDVEERIKRAQLAILNPSTPAEEFLTVDLPFSQSKESRFSKNSIILDISGPGVDDLVFVDLPGAYQARPWPWHTTNCILQVLSFPVVLMGMNEIFRMSRPSLAAILRNRTA